MTDILNTLFELRGLDDFPSTAFIPGSTSVSFAVISHAGRIIEILINKARVGGILPMVNLSLPILSSAAVKAFMWVISRVIKNWSASFVPGSSQKLMSLS